MKRIIDYFHPLQRINRQRKKYLSTTRVPKVFYQLLTQPTIEISDLAKDFEYIVLDLETTGLDCEDDRILSIGWVEVSQGKVDLSTAHHLYIDEVSQVNPETAVINHITPQMLSNGVSLHDAMMAFFDAARGKLIVAHACIVEEHFINHYLHTNFHIQHLPLIWIDTLCLEKSMLKAINQHEDADVTLSGTRARYHLPEYNGHNALADAISTAELLLVQQKRLTDRKEVTIGQLYRLSH